MMKVYELAKAVDPYVVSMRRYFHENPELSNQEDKTIERIGQELDAMGIRYEVVPKGGIIGYIEGTKPGQGKTVLLRAGQPGRSPCLLLQGRRCNACLRS